jgi:signal transduction histidine kinase
VDGAEGQPLAHWLHLAPHELAALLATTRPWHARAALFQGERLPVDVTVEAYPHGDALVILVLPEVVSLLRTQEECSAINSQLTNLNRERAKQAAQLKRALGDLEAAHQRLADMDRLKTRFYATMNHELRTPLSSIIGFAEDALDGLAGPLSDELRQYFTTIHHSGRRQLALINDVLDLARLQAGHVTLDRSTFMLGEVAEEVRATLRPLLGRKRQTLEVLLPEDAALSADPQRVFQILLNLLSNAHKFAPEGGHIALSAARTADGWLVTVDDDGPGIPPDELPAVFEEFRQVHAGGQRAPGTGLGLAIARWLVELHGGRIWAENRAEGGARFAFTLPVAV